MHHSIIRRLGLDRVAEAIAADVRRVRLEVLVDEWDRLSKVVADIDVRMLHLGG